MINYIRNFFDEFDYEENDAKFLIASYEKIQKNTATCALFDDIIAEYDANIDCDYIKMIDTADKIANILYIHEYTLEFLMFVAMTRRLRERYIENGINLEIYHNTILDLKYKVAECKLVRGICGSFVATWFIDFFKMRRFGLGRLQFEIVPLGYDYENNDGVRLGKESRVINVHIPRSCTPLTPESCDLACNMAREYFKGKYDEPCAFVCHSWLLYPENEKIIPKKTNTYKFFSRFEIIDSGVYKDNSHLWRLFDTDERNFERLPADSSIRRAYVEHLKAGGKTGWGMGIFF
jgi:hypothetical protein